jgi:hypothetical protein
MVTIVITIEAAMSHHPDWALKVKGILKAELKKRHVSYKQLADKLAEMGVPDSEANIKNKISRGAFTAVFFVQCLEAIGCHTLHISDN